MSNDFNREPSKSKTVRPPSSSPKPTSRQQQEDEVLREQSKTETEQRPYLDTEGGE